MLHYTLNVCLVIFVEWAAIAYCELHITNIHPTCFSYIQPYLHNIFVYYSIIHVYANVSFKTVYAYSWM